MDSTEREIVLLRTKLEIRTWFLRVSLGINIAMFTGFIINLALR